jgi:hypothetical protein
MQIGDAMFFFFFSIEHYNTNVAPQKLLDSINSVKKHEWQVDRGFRTVNVTVKKLPN